MDTIAPASTGLSTDTSIAELSPTLARLRTAWMARRPDQAQRRDDLLRLREVLKRRLGEMADTVAADFGHRSRHETLLADGMTVLTEIDHLRSHLRKWMKPRRVGVGWRFWPARAEIRPEPVGVVGVIAPWNYPVNLALIPLATAIAAGNHVYLKPSEHTPATTEFLRSLLAEVFPADRVAVASGGAEIAGAFSALPFDHLVFTGSTAVGRKVMAAAAPHLTPLTLELGGKSPAIVCADFPVQQAAARLATGKWFNGGQTCIAPDYVLIDEGRAGALADALREQVRARYGNLEDASDYTRIINDGQYARLQGYVDDANARGLQVLPLTGNADARQRLFPPTLVLEPGDDARVMQEEIFGPILPIKSYRSLDEAIAYINAHDRPLSLYPFSHDRANVEKILRNTLAGGVTVNDTVLHFGINNLPFGGIGPSGMGAYHSRAGFDAFSKALPILWQPRRAGSDMLKPPYSKVARFIDFIECDKLVADAEQATPSPAAAMSGNERMKIASWNVNSLNVRLPHLQQWLGTFAPDVVGIQETKLEDHKFPDTALAEAGYRSVFAGQKTYNGVALLSRLPASDVQMGIPGFDDEQKRVIAATVDDVRIVNLYVVNGQDVGTEKYAYKLRWLQAVHAWLENELRTYPKLVVLGDFNIAPDERDVHDATVWNEDHILTSTAEREALKRLQALGLHDAYRLHHAEGGVFSWWDYRMAGFRRDLGLRIDLTLVSEALRESAHTAGIDREPRTWERPSDHAPAWVQLGD